ncbi:MAG: hypothetical protein WA990_08605 [Rubrobacteraceae bacterium]
MKHQLREEQEKGQSEGGSRWKHWGLMALCCMPMIALVVLIVLGVWNF